MTAMTMAAMCPFQRRDWCSSLVMTKQKGCASWSDVVIPVSYSTPYLRHGRAAEHDRWQSLSRVRSGESMAE